MRDSENNDRPPPRRRLRLPAVALGMVIGAVAALAIGTVLLIVSAGDAPPLLTIDRFDEALARWHEHGPRSYNLDLELAGRQGGEIHLEVRDGRPTAMTRDRITPSQRVWEYWTVPEQFEMIHRELTAEPQVAFGVPDRASIILRAEFDPRLGYPRRYQREVLGRDESIRWQIVRFEEAR